MIMSDWLPPNPPDIADPLGSITTVRKIHKTNDLIQNVDILYKIVYFT